jgi:hypothetical protein
MTKATIQEGQRLDALSEHLTGLRCDSFLELVATVVGDGWLAGWVRFASDRHCPRSTISVLPQPHRTGWEDGNELILIGALAHVLRSGPSIQDASLTTAVSRQLVGVRFSSVQALALPSSEQWQGALPYGAAGAT